jgi:PPOX class probable F420-dependent enzyme
MGVPLSEEIRTLLRGPNFAHLATLMADGSPQVAPVWVDLEGDRILVGTSETSLKGKNTKGDPRVGISVVGQDNPYLEAQIRGRVVERRADPRFEIKDRIARKYTGKPFPWRNDPDQQVILVIEADRARHAALPFKHTPA